MSNIGIRSIQVESKIYRADGTLKHTEKHVLDVTNERYEQLKKDGMI